MNNKNNNAVPLWRILLIIVPIIVGIRIALTLNPGFNFIAIIISLVFLCLAALVVVTVITNSYMKKHKLDVVRLYNHINCSRDLEDYFATRDELVMHLSKMAKTQFMIEKSNQLSEKPSRLLAQINKDEESHIHIAIILMESRYRSLTKETGRNLSDRFSEQVTKYASRLSADNLKVAQRCVEQLREYSSVVGRIEEADNMDGHAFERWCADLLKNNGFSNIEVTRGSGDQGVDVLAEKSGIRYAVQCKCYSSDLSNKPVQEVHAGKAMYHCQIGAVMTNRYFTAGAKELADVNGVLLWDRDKLIKMLDTQNARLTES